MFASEAKWGILKNAFISLRMLLKENQHGFSISENFLILREFCFGRSFYIIRKLFHDISDKSSFYYGKNIETNSQNTLCLICFEMPVFQNKWSLIYTSKFSEAICFAWNHKATCFHFKSNQNGFPNIDVFKNIKMPNSNQILLPTRSSRKHNTVSLYPNWQTKGNIWSYKCQHRAQLTSAKNSDSEVKEIF